MAAAWRKRPDGLTLIAGRRASAMPGARFPRGVGTFPTRDQLVRHLERFARHHQVRLLTGVAVERIERDGECWLVRSPGAVISARHVVVASGLFAEPVVPDWPGRVLLGDRLVHAAEYRNPKPFVEQDVLVVGAGTTAVEIASEIEAGGARSVRLSVRTRPNLIPRSLGALPGLKLMLKLPDRIGDAQMRIMRRASIGDLSEFGLGSPIDGPFATLRKRHCTPTNIGKDCVRAIRAGRIRIVASVESVDERGAQLADGTHVDVDTVLAATGYRSGLNPLVGHLDVLDGHGEPRAYSGDGQAFGLHFAGFENVPGQLAFCGDAARRVVKEIATDAGVRER